MKEEIVFIILMLLVSCTPNKVYPNTTEVPELKFIWDYPLNESLVKGMGPFGVIESHGEVATEIEIHLKKWHDPIYSMTSGVVVEIQKDKNSGEPGTVQGVWVRYGKNVLLKYVHVFNVSVTEGEIVNVGDVLGYTAKFRDYGFFEVELRIKEGDNIYAYPFYDYCDSDCKTILEPLWHNENLQYGRNLKIPWKVMERYDVSNTMRHLTRV